MLSRTLAALAAASLLGAGSVAAAQSAAPLSLSNGPAAARAGAEVEDAGQLRGPARWVLGGIALALLIWGIIELTGDNERDFPTSP